MKIKRTIELFILLIWLTIGIYLIFCNINLVIIIPMLLFFTVVVLISMNRGYYALTIFSVCGFLAHGINSFFFFANKQNYTKTGWNAIGNFKFNVQEFYTKYILVFIFFSFIIVLLGLLKNKKNILEGSYQKFLGKMKYKPLNTIKYSIILKIFIIFFAIPLNLLMYKLRIIVGVPPISLPFHLVGLLYYFRLLIMPIILSWLYCNSQNTILDYLLVIIYALCAGLASGSRSLFIITMGVCIGVNFIRQKQTKVFVAITVTILGFYMVSKSRNFTYWNEELSYINMVLETLKEVEISGFIDVIFQVCDGITGRLYGAQCIILASQYRGELTFFDSLKYIIGKPFGQIIPELSSELFGLNFPPNMAFGVGVGLIGQIIILSNSNYYVFVIYCVFTAIILYVFDKIVVDAFNLNDTVGVFVFIVVAYLTLQLWLGESLDKIYLFIFSYYFFCKIYKNKL